MAVPKKKGSRARRDKRRSHDSITLTNFSTCPHCNEPKLPHHVCLKCGMYKGVEVIKVNV
ncbi:MAG: 50S ribosomal protein L32 [Nitrospinae bacterium]|nr:50S ribosomal protein L32 [Nitrospinota bacterium]